MHHFRFRTWYTTHLRKSALIVPHAFNRLVVGQNTNFFVFCIDATPFDFPLLYRQRTKRPASIGTCCTLQRPDIRSICVLDITRLRTSWDACCGPEPERSHPEYIGHSYSAFYYTRHFGENAEFDIFSVWCSEPYNDGRI
jgi:hypothetical protein